MPRSEDANLLRAAKRGNRRAREQIVRAQMGMVRAIAARYRDLGLALDDLVQEGTVGLLQAVERYDARRGTDFDAYARFQVRRAIRNALTEQSRIIRLPKQVVERRRAIDRVESALTGATGRTPTPLEVAAAAGLSPAAVIEARTLAATFVSLDQPFLPDGSTLESVIADTSAVDPEAETVEHEKQQLVDDAVAHLPARQREIVSRHFGLDRSPEQIAEVAAELHLSQQRARAIERDALYTLRDRLDPRVTRRPTR